MLKGDNLLNKVRLAGDLSKSDLVRECGYASSDKNGREILNFSAFYEAVVEAKGAGVEHSDQDGIECDEIECDVLIDGCIRVPLPKEICRSPIGKYGIYIDEWDPYYPGCPLRVVTLDKDLRIPNDSDSDFESSDCFHSIAISDGDTVVIQGDWLKSGERYIVETSNYEWQFALEPMPWNGLDDRDEECLRLLVIPKSSIDDLLSLCHSEQESLFNPAQFESFEAALADSLRRAISLVRSESARGFLAKFKRNTTGEEEKVAKNWLCYERINEFPLLSRVLQ